MLTTTIALVGVVGAFEFGWRQLRHRPPGVVRLLCWILFLIMFHMAAAH